LTGEVKNRAEWGKSIMEATVNIGLQCHFRKKEEEKKKKKKKNLP
jgi:hypothetical protein